MLTYVDLQVSPRIAKHSERILAENSKRSSEAEVCSSSARYVFRFCHREILQRFLSIHLHSSRDPKGFRDEFKTRSNPGARLV